MIEKIFVYGASGHAKVVIDIIERQGLYDIEYLVDDDPALKGQEVYGYKVLGGKPELLASDIRLGIVAIGSNTARCRVAALLTDNCFELISAIHPSAHIARGVTMGRGTVVMAGTVVNSDTLIGDNVIVNTNASIDHDCVIADSVHIAPGCILCGTVTVGTGTFLGAGATVIPNISVGEHAIVGAGATVVKDVPDRVIVVGTPARINRRL